MNAEDLQREERAWNMAAKFIPRFQIPVFFDLFHLSNLPLLIKGTVPLLDPQTPFYSFCMETHWSLSSLTPTTFVHLQKGWQWQKRRIWKTPFCSRKPRICPTAWELKKKPRRDVLQFFPFTRELCFSSKGATLRVSMSKTAIFHARGNKIVSKSWKAITTLHKQQLSINLSIKSPSCAAGTTQQLLFLQY